MTNNPDKFEALSNAGIEIVERIPVIVRASPHKQSVPRDQAEKAGPRALTDKPHANPANRLWADRAKSYSTSFGTVKPPSDTMRAKSPLPCANSTNRPVSTMRPWFHHVDPVSIGRQSKGDERSRTSSVFAKPVERAFDFGLRSAIKCARRSSRIRMGASLGSHEPPPAADVRRPIAMPRARR